MDSQEGPSVSDLVPPTVHNGLVSDQGQGFISEKKEPVLPPQCFFHRKYTDCQIPDV